jgi:RNA polymerase sigma-70 factor, ECF subfamily
MTPADTSRVQARPWLYGIATMLIARQRRSEQRLYRALARTGVDPLPEPIADQVVRRVADQGQQRRLAAALAGLSPADRAPELPAVVGLSLANLRLAASAVH